MALVVAAGFSLFRPDWYHQQNDLDPYFYTGLSLNLSDVIDYGAEAHYFISRWTLYLPELLAQRALGPSVGFVATRLLLLLLAGAGLAMLRPTGSRRADLVLVAVVGLFSPLVARAVFVDYSDAVIVPCGLLMVGLAAKGRIGLRSSAALGALGACALVANAFAVFMVAITIGGYLSRFLSPSRRLVTQMLMVSAAGTAVVGAGLVFFRWRYGIDNVYAPTIEFVRSNTSYSDPLRSTGRLWMQYELWIYLPPLVLVAAAGLRMARVINLGRDALVVLGMCAAQYAFQVVYQFFFDGLTLELHYYFSYMLPAYTAGLAVLLYALAQRCSERAIWSLTAAAAGTLAAWRYLPEVRLGSWIVFCALVATIAAAGAILARRLPVVLPAGVISLVFAAQLAYPRHEPTPGERRPAGYDTLYRGGTSSGVKRFRSISSFVRKMHELDVEVRKDAGWIIGGGTGHQKAAAYSVHVAKPYRWLNPPRPGDLSPPANLSAYAVDRLVELDLDHVVVVATPEELPKTLGALDALGVVVGPPLLDYVDRVAPPATQVYVAPVARQPSAGPRSAGGPPAPASG